VPFVPFPNLTLAGDVVSARRQAAKEVPESHQKFKEILEQGGPTLASS
jgi:hypothetical protein